MSIIDGDGKAAGQAPCSIRDRSPGQELVQAGVTVTAPYKDSSIEANVCESCGYIYFPTPSPRVLDDYYNRDYPQAAKSWYNLKNDYSEWKTQPRAQRVIDIAARYGFDDRGSYHEIGCAFGGTVHAMNGRGFRTTGTEMNKAAVEEGCAHGNAEIFAEDTRQFLARLPQKPDVIFGYHVLEHLINPIKFLSELRQNLSNDGILVFFLPNALTLFPLIYGYVRYSWFAFPAHLHLYSPRSVLCLAQAAGYSVLDVATHIAPVHPEAAARALSGESTEAGRAVRDQVLEDALLAEELRFVLTPEGSGVARRHAADISFQAERCRRNGAAERSLIELIRDAELATPPG